MLPAPLFAVALTREGARLLGRVAGAFPGVRAYAPRRLAGGTEGVEGFEEPVAALVARLWTEASGFVLVMAAGIAVRSIAPLLRDKAADPAVVVMDQEGRFAIPLLSGHLGGANDLARELAKALGATPVLTTATDAAGLPAIEVWAREKGFRWEGRAGVVAVNAAWVNGEPVGAYVAEELEGSIDDLRPHLCLATSDAAEARGFEGVLIAVTDRSAEEVPAVLRLRPPCLCLGVGCRKGADPGEVEEGVRAALKRAGLSPLAAAEVVSVDEKAAEPALLGLARSLGVPFRTYPAAELAGVPVPTPSKRVAEALGTSSVSEAAALLAAEGGPLVVPKVKGKSWTLAVALRVARSKT